MARNRKVEMPKRIPKNIRQRTKILAQFKREIALMKRESEAVANQLRLTPNVVGSAIDKHAKISQYAKADGHLKAGGGVS